MFRLLIIYCIALLMPLKAWAFESKSQTFPALVRRPIVIMATNGKLVVANRDSGTLSFVDIEAGKLVAEHSVAKQILDAALGADGHVLVVDSKQGRVIRVNIQNATHRESLGVKTLCDLPKPVASPGKVIATKSGDVIFSSQWARRVVRLQMGKDSQSIRQMHSESLDFPPGEMTLSRDGNWLFVADAFGGQLAIVNTSTWKLLRQVKLHAHNIRGLAVNVDGARLFVTHQILNPRGQADFDGVHWGSLLTNVMRVLSIPALLDPKSDAMKDGWVEQHGRTGFAAGDPNAVLVDDRGTLAVALAGTGEVAVTQTSYADRIKVGCRPVDMAVVDRQLFVLNQFDETVSVIELQNGKVTDTISLGPKQSLTSSQRGEELFFNAKVSHDGWMSCHSCHSNGHTSGLLVDTLGDGGYGNPKRIPSLLGTAKTGPWAWIGFADSLEQQIGKSVKTTMHGKKLTTDQVGDLAAYLRSLKSPPSRFQKASANEIQAGNRVFQSQGCSECHQQPKYTSRRVVDVGLKDEAGIREFNPPSLLGLGQRDTFFHDGRVKSVEDVVRKTRHQLTLPLSPADESALIAFLKSL